MSNDAVAAMKAAREWIQDREHDRGYGCDADDCHCNRALVLGKLDAAIKAQEETNPQINYYGSSISHLFNNSPLCHIGARPWAVFPSSTDDEASRWRHGESLSEPPGDAIAYLPAYELERLRSGHSASVHSARFGPSTIDGDIPLYLSPRPAAQISDERIREIGKDVFGIDLNFDGNLITFAHALLREAAPKEGA